MTIDKIEKQAVRAYNERKAGNNTTAQLIEHKLWFNILRTIAKGGYTASDILLVANNATNLAEYQEIY